MHEHTVVNSESPMKCSICASSAAMTKPITVPLMQLISWPMVMLSSMRIMRANASAKPRTMLSDSQ